MYDFYDDREGVLLKEEMGQEKLQGLLKHGHVLSIKEIHDLPDRLFSLVMTTNDGRLRKYARNDTVNTVVSTIYFLNNWRNLPVEAVKVAAVNLVEACDWYDLEIPPQLKKLAVGVMGMGFGIPWVKDIAAKGEQKRKRFMAAAGMPRHMIDPDTPKVPKVASPYIEPKLGSTADEFIDIDLASEIQHTIKLASLTDITRAVDTYKQKSWGWTPEHKVAFCRPLSVFAHRVGRSCDLPDEVLRYGNTKVASPGYTVALLEARKQCFPDEQTYTEYLTKVAGAIADTTGDELATKLAAIERELGVDHYWGYEIQDPWLAVYGLYKTAEYTFDDGGKSITETELRQTAATKKEELKGKFDEEFVRAFVSDPVAIFDSMPLDHKRLIIKIKEGN